MSGIFYVFFIIINFFSVVLASVYMYCNTTNSNTTKQYFIFNFLNIRPIT